MASARHAWSSARARSTRPNEGRATAKLFPASRKMDGSTAGSTDSRSAGAVLEMRIVGAEASPCEGAQSSPSEIPRGNAPLGTGLWAIAVIKPHVGEERLRS